MPNGTIVLDPDAGPGDNEETTSTTMRRAASAHAGGGPRVSESEDGRDTKLTHRRNHGWIQPLGGTDSGRSAEQTAFEGQGPRPSSGGTRRGLFCGAPFLLFHSSMEFA
jgi:hypothetical protein